MTYGAGTLRFDNFLLREEELWLRKSAPNVMAKAKPHVLSSTVMTIIRTVVLFAEAIEA